MVILLEKLTGLVVFALDGGATVVIDIILPAVPGKRVKINRFLWMTLKIRKKEHFSLLRRQVIRHNFLKSVVAHFVWFWLGNLESKGADLLVPTVDSASLMLEL